MMFDGLELRILLCDYLLLKKCEQKGMTMSLLMMMMPSLFLRPFESFFYESLYDEKLNLLSV